MKNVFIQWFMCLSFAMPVAFPASAQELRFDLAHTLGCLQRAAGPAEQKACIGASANACMSATPDGSSTYGMTGCIDHELTYWDDRLNASYQRLRTREKSEDAEWGSAPGAVSQADALREMQRAWIPFRDRKCDYERAQWGGGTGGGPVMMACLMEMTGAQTLFLEQMMADY